MKRTIIYCVFGALSGLFLAAFVSRPSVETSSLYKNYEPRREMSVNFVKGYPVDDSTNVDVTIITAKDSAAWVALLGDFAVPEEFVQHYFDCIRQGKPVFTDMPRDTGCPQKQVIPSEVTSYDYIIFTSNEMSLFVFHVDSNAQAKIIHNKKWSNLFSNQPINNNEFI